MSILDNYTADEIHTMRQDMMEDQLAADIASRHAEWCDRSECEDDRADRELEEGECMDHEEWDEASAVAHTDLWG